MDRYIIASIYILGMLGLFKYSRMLFFTLFSIIFAMTWRFVSALYIDSSDGIYSIELLRNIGNGSSSFVLIIIYFFFFLAILLIFRPSKLQNLMQGMISSPKTIIVNGIRLNSVCTFLLGIFISFLYIELLQGPIPFFAGIDKIVYKANYGGPGLQLLYKYRDFISFFSGVLLLNEIRKQGKTNYTVLILFGAINVYLILVGNKFGAMFFSTCMFIIPLSLLLLNHGSNKRTQYGRKASGKAHLLRLGILILLIVALMGIAMHNYYFHTKSWDKEYSYRHFKHRLFVQQAQIWWTSFDRVFNIGLWNPEEALSYTILNPLYTDGGNPSIRYLMYKDIGSKAFIQFKAGSTFSGAYPAVLLELFGPIGAFPAAFICSLIMALLLYALMRAIVKSHFLSIFFIAFVFKPFLTLHLTGNFSFVLNWHYWVKILLMLFALFVENSALYFKKDHIQELACGKK